MSSFKHFEGTITKLFRIERIQEKVDGKVQVEHKVGQLGKYLFELIALDLFQSIHLERQVLKLKQNGQVIVDFDVSGRIAKLATSLLCQGRVVDLVLDVLEVDWRFICCVLVIKV